MFTLTGKFAGLQKDHVAITVDSNGSEYTHKVYYTEKKIKEPKGLETLKSVEEGVEVIIGVVPYGVPKKDGKAFVKYLFTGQVVK